MDMIFVEYADPFKILDSFIAIGRLNEFLLTFVKKKEERKRWEYYVHKIPAWNEITWEEFNQRFEPVEVYSIPDEEITNTIGHSYDVLQGFIPEERGC